MSLVPCPVILAILSTPSTTGGAQLHGRPPRRSFATHLLEEAVPDLSRAPKISVLYCVALRDIKAHGRRAGCATAVCSISRPGA